MQMKSLEDFEMVLCLVLLSLNRQFQCLSVFELGLIQKKNLRFRCVVSAAEKNCSSQLKKTIILDGEFFCIPTVVICLNLPQFSEIY